MKKSTRDIEDIINACKVTDSAFKHIVPYLKENVSEKEIVKKINKFLRKHSNGLAFKTIVSFGENSSEVHHIPTERKLKKGDIIMLDFGAKINGLCSDMSRTLIFGKATKKQKDLYLAVSKAQQIAIDYLKSSIAKTQTVKAFDVDKIARDYLNSKNYPPMPHSLGHGIGRKVHSGLRLSPKSNALLKSGMVFTIEPGVYIKEFGGVRIEDTVMIIKQKVLILTKSTKELIET